LEREIGDWAVAPCNANDEGDSKRGGDDSVSHGRPRFWFAAERIGHNLRRGRTERNRTRNAGRDVRLTPGLGSTRLKAGVQKQVRPHSRSEHAFMDREDAADESQHL
jgi:hypothetical protein